MGFNRINYDRSKANKTKRKLNSDDNFKKRRPYDDNDNDDELYAEIKKSLSSSSIDPSEFI